MKLFTLLFFFLLFIFSVITKCQVWQNPYPSGNDYSKIFFSSSSNGWCVGTSGEIVATTDGGNNWFAQESNTNKNLNDIQFVSNSEGWVVGDSIILSTTNGGQIWLEQKSPNVILESVNFIDKLHGWSCGKGTVLRTSDGGAIWTTVLSDTINQFTSVSFENEDTGWVVGTDHVLKTYDGGSTWSDVTDSLNLPNANYQKVKFFGSSGWLVASENLDLGPYNQKLVGLIWKTDNEGLTWKPVYTDTTWYNYRPNYFLCSSFLDTLTGYIQTLSGAFLTTDGGSSWLPDTALYQNDAFIISKDEIYTVGNLGYIGTSRDGGRSWTKLSRGASGYLSRVQFFNDQIGIASGGTYNGSSFLRTTDGGKHWNTTTDIFNKNGIIITDQSFISPMTGWISTFWFHSVPIGPGSEIVYNEGVIFKTSDGGYSWTRELDTTYHFPRLYEIKFIDSTNGIAAGEGIILRTTNGGSSWETEYSNFNGAQLYGGIAWLDSLNQWIAGNGQLWHTTNCGETWQSIGISNYYSRSIFFINDSTGWVAGNQNVSGLLFKTIDGGKTWSKVLTGHSTSYNSIFFSDSLNGYLVGDNAFFAKTSDGGQTWNFISLKHVNKNLRGMFVRDNEHAWIVGDDGIILTVQDLITGINESSSVYLPSGFKLYQNYPNPFNPSTKIRYQIRVFSHVTLKIYDVLGREVKTLVNREQNPGSYNLTFNTVNLPSGVYFYRLEAGSFSQTKKLILIK